MNSKAKGSRFERAIGKWLTEWTGFKFERNRAGSGAWHTNKDSVSDITCTDERHAHRCKISIECKSYKDIKFEHVLLGNKGCDVERFWAQAKGDALRANRKPILIMRYNSMPKNEFFMVVDSDLAEAFLTDEMYNQRYMALHNGTDSLYVFMASSVKKYVSYKDVHKLSKRLIKD